METQVEGHAPAAAWLHAVRPSWRREGHGLKIRRSSGRVLPSPIILLTLLLAACGGARVSDIQYGAVQPARQPEQVLVRASVAETPGEAASAEAEEAARSLARQIASDLCNSGVPAEPIGHGASPVSAAILDISLTQLDQGSTLQRIVVGFGMGQSKLQAAVKLVLPDLMAPEPAVAFDTSADSGHKPGLLLPAGVGYATGNIVRSAIAGGAGLALNLRGGSSADIEHAASAITEQVQDYFQDVGWSQWPPAATPAGSCAAGAAARS
ncbi:DUF4410 domain-containing protein [Inquilinus sp. Marseille-Q2685]|uniref:DUF4410 domain-containing protein n=1 Tax=Inquilinus sp. Marseille-Q2685 TaxID=2866581 RepID=UPI001CE3CDA6|nr:DUF4410 domain-containing protein [Inquilinus sp. Marseille-Q2685]